jgi:hypothetical protein
MARLFALVVLLWSSAASAQVMAGDDEPETQFERPEQMSTPWGLLDRMQIAPARLSLTTELGSHDGADTATTTLHAQVSTSCDCRFGAYFTLPLAYSLVEPVGVAAAGTTPPQPSRLGFGTADVGLFFSPKDHHEETIWRVGALLPTAPAGGQPHTISARAGDMILELPRSAGARFSASHLFGYLQLPSSWFGTRSYGALRFDTGLDMGYELDRGPAERAMHVVPHAGLGSLFAFRPFTVSIDTVLAMDPTDQGDMNVRWSTGVTGRLARMDRDGSWFEPGVTLALVRTPDGWGGTIAIDLAATRHRHRSNNYYDD